MDQILLNSRPVTVGIPRSFTASQRSVCIAQLDEILGQTDIDTTKALTTLRSTPRPSLATLVTFSTLLDVLSPPWSVFALLCCHAWLWKHLPEEAKTGRSPGEAAIVQNVSRQVKAKYCDLMSLLPASDRPAIRDSSSSLYLSHSAIRTFVRGFRIPSTKVQSTRPVIAVALANGPLLGLAILATANYFTAAPLSVSGGAEQFRRDVLQSKAVAVLVSRKDVRRLGLEDAWVAEADIDVVYVEPRPDLTFTMEPLHTSNRPSANEDEVQPQANSPDDTALLLFTSGTSGTKKSVPITVHTIVSGVAFVIESWGLKDTDVCLNMMPLFHVGGIVRNLFAPIMAGGSTICSPAFDANLFWDTVEDQHPTWYYASPSMHSVILEEARNRPAALAKSRMRLICNAAGGLLPSLAANLQHTFDCIVLPSYGMTECMPITSPPLDYRLDRPGTSGVSVGPEIGILDSTDVKLASGVVGRIAVRGTPVFGGYLKPNGHLDTSSFTEDGWFDTGDLGYLDQDGYLFVTGRNKEVINRGGELISPFEIEEAILSAAQCECSPTFKRIIGALAFSMPHDVLQEVVGVVIVTPPETPRPCLKSVQLSVRNSLNQVKWPVYLVYMDDLPKNNNKILRVNLADRLGLTTLADSVPSAKRHWEALCPPPNTALCEKICGRPCRPDLKGTSRMLKEYVGSGFDVYVRATNTDDYSEAFIAPSIEASRPTVFTDVLPLEEAARARLHGYDVPTRIHCLPSRLPLDAYGNLDTARLDPMMHPMNTLTRADSRALTECDTNKGETASRVASIVASVLLCPVREFNTGSDFFEMGGDSLKAGRLLSELRKEFHVRYPIDALFGDGRIGFLADTIDDMVGKQAAKDDQRELEKEAPMPLDLMCEETYSSTYPILLMLQLIPLVLLYPMKRALTWTVFMYALTVTQSWSTSASLHGRLLNLILCLGIGRAITRVIAPFVGIATKWIIIGRYQEGIYPMWGPYHTRWWFVQKVLAICGRGGFELSNATLIWYYRLLGARIGKGVTISPSATIGEYDLLELQDGVNLDKCICRGFAVEQNTSMFLGRIRLGKQSSIGLNSIVAPGTSLGDGLCIGPNSSTWETDGADEAFRDLSSSKIPGAHFLLDLLIAMPISGIVTFCRAAPWMAGLIGLVQVEPSKTSDQVQTTINWFAEPYRLGFHYLALILNAYFGPMAWFLIVFLVKGQLDGFLGRHQPGTAATRGAGQRLRMSIMKKIASVSQFHKLVEIFGSHYEFTSFFYRALGAKIGKRVYWPGTGPSFQDFDLLDVGDDVVFGSRSHIITSDGYGSNPVRIEKNAMVSDRVVILPGVTIGEKTVLGSGALTRRNKRYESENVWVGSKDGEAVCLSQAGRRGAVTEVALTKHLEKRLTIISTKEVDPLDEDIESGKTTLCMTSAVATPPPEPATAPEDLTSSSPFGRAFYEGRATYRVYGLPVIVLYTGMITIFTAFYWNIATTSSVQIIARLMPSVSPTPSPSRPVVIYMLFTFFISLILSLQALLALAIVIGAKWILLGRRKPGNYSWDTSPYCQRWQLLLTIERLRRSCYGGNGILSLLTGTHYLVLYYRLLGATIGRDCALFASGDPSCLLTEPDLLTLGDRVAVDDASLVGHINSRGKFDLNELVVGDGCVMRSGSRLLSGARMGKGSVLMEHTLVMAGDVVEDGAVMQGWPGEQGWKGCRTPVRSQMA